MNKLDARTRSLIIRLLVEGNSIRATSRIAEVSKNTVNKMLIDAGKVCAAFHDKHVRGITSMRIQCDEIWSFTYAKEKNVKDAKSAPGWAGDTWTWTALDADTKLIVTYLIGGRDAGFALDFLEDLKDRLDNPVQLTTDGHNAYVEGVRKAFGSDVQYAQLIKLYGKPTGSKGHEQKYSPTECTGTKKRNMIGKPDEAHISTSFVERQNLTMRMHMRRFTRLTNAFSKKVENHSYAVALHFMYYNFCRIHQTLKVTPAMAAGITDRLFDVEDIVKLVEEREALIDRTRGPYKKRTQKEISE